MEEKFRLQLLIILIKIDGAENIGLYMSWRTQTYSLYCVNILFVENPSLESLRDEIDEIDSQIVRLLNQRVQAAVEIGRIKDELGVDPYDPAREEEVFKKLRA